MTLSLVYFMVSDITLNEWIMTVLLYIFCKINATVDE